MPVTTVASLSRTAQKPLAAAQASSATLTRLGLKSLPSSVQTLASATKLLFLTLRATQKAGHSFYTITLSASSASVATLSHVRIVGLSATQTQAASLRRTTLKSLSTGSQMTLPPIFQSLTPVGSLAWIVSRLTLTPTTPSPLVLLGTARETYGTAVYDLERYADAAYGYALYGEDSYTEDPDPDILGNLVPLVPMPLQFGRR